MNDQRNVVIAVAALCAGSSMCFGQWSDDPAVNSPIVTESGEQIQPKLVPTGDGGAYISWFDNRDQGYDVYLQRIDADGEAQWAAGGVLIADRSFSSTQDYGLGVDSDGHAVVAFRDDRFGGVEVTASRVAPDGTQVWSNNGVQLSEPGSFVGAIHVEGLSDGNVAVGWFNGDAARVVKLDAGGNELWDTNIDGAPNGSFTVSDLIASDSASETGEVAVLMTTFGGFTTPRHIYAQKLDVDGTTQWAAPAAIYTAGSIQIGYFPSGMTDGNGGLVTTWYETSPLQVRVQHVDSSGSIQFAADGAEVSTNAKQTRVSPSAAYDQATGDTYVFWNEQDALQSAIGVYGQRLNAAGDRQWGDGGARVLETSNETTQVRTVLVDGTAQVYFAESLSPVEQRLVGAAVATDGSLPWSGEVVEISNVSSGKSRLAAMVRDEQTILVWEDTRNGAADLYSQLVNDDGSLGDDASGIVGDLNDDGQVNVSDLLILLGEWGDCPAKGACPADLNDDGSINVSDMLVLLGNWG